MTECVTRPIKGATMSRFSEIPQPGRGGELFGLAWADQRATNYICTNCGYVFWFAE
jgi:hypothetical protein